ncbi:MAG: signal peptide peptidase SppA [Acidobacteriota bacterium]|nr:MAG: signal peptide peptidase SppA [Acidobacteriota bacterium]
MGNKKFWILLILLLTVVVLAIAVGAGLLWILNLPVSIDEGSTLEIVLSGGVAEFPAQDPFAELFSSGGRNIWEIREALKGASTDPRISALHLQVYPVMALSWAQIEELREIIGEFRESGKKVYTFLAVDMITERELYLVSGTDHIAVNPTSGLILNGLMTEVVFMKRTMDKLGVKPQFIQFKEFKSAETYTRESMSPEIRGMLEAILRELQDRFVETVAEDRSVASEELSTFMRVGLGTAQTAVEMGLIDQAAYRGDVIKTIEEAEGSDYKSISLDDYLDSDPTAYASPKARIAVVGAFGMITSGRSDAFSGIMGGSTVSKRLQELRENRLIDGVILRVNSPGGSAVGSDMIWEEVRKLEEAGKPVIVSMSGVAGSGGYYISMGARRIVSQPSTITGSIGVIFGKFDLSGLYEWLGMDIDRIKLAENSDLLSVYSSLTPLQREQVEEWMSHTYETFVEKAAQGRGMEYDELEPKAHGKIYTGNQALAEGLVDRLGGFTVAVEEMKSALDLQPEDRIKLEIYPKPKTALQLLASGELFEIRMAPSLLENIRQELQSLEQPRIWLLSPEISID